MESFINSMASRSASTLDGGEYVGENGLLYCSKCHTPRQTIIDTPWASTKKMTVTVMCDCRIKVYEKEKKKRREQERSEYIYELRKDGVSSNNRKYLEFTFENDDGANQQISKVCKDYVDNWQKMKDLNSGVLFYGKVGNGKSFLACAIVNALIDMGIRAGIVNLSELINRLQGTWKKEEVFVWLQKFSLLVIDDLGIERDTSYGLEQTFNVVDARYRSGKPTIFTTNLTLSELQNPTGRDRERIYDRVMGMCPIRLRMDGESRREQEAQRKRDETLKALGMIK